MNVTSYGQRGGITAGSVSVTNAPEADLNAAKTVVNERMPDGLYRTRWRVRITAPHAIAKLCVAARGSSVEKIDLRPDAQAFMLGVSTGQLADGTKVVCVHTPITGVMLLDVTTREPEGDRVALEWKGTLH